MEQIGRYSIERLLARGGMAEVYIGKVIGPAGFSKQVVLKRILPELAEDPAFVEMFLSEARLAALLDHPNVVHVFDFGVHEGQYYLTMEYVRGQTLRVLLKHFVSQRKPMPAQVAVRIAIGVCEGLQYAHDLTEEDDGPPLNIVHRDVAPDNIMVTSSGIPKLVDFGVAKAMSNTHKSTAGTLKGKYAYMSPELIKGGLADRQVDVYALGVTLFELVAGRRPFVAETELALVHLIVGGQVPSAHEVNPAVPPELSRIIATAMAPEKEQRFADARSLQAALEDWSVASPGRVGAAELAGLVDEVTRARRGAVSHSGESSGPKAGAMGTPVSSKSGQAPVLGIGSRPSMPTVQPPVIDAELDVSVDEPPAKARKGPPVALLALLGVGVLGLGAAGALLFQRSVPSPPPVVVVERPAPVKPEEPVKPEPEPTKPEPEAAKPEPAPAPAAKPKATSTAAAAPATGEDGYLTLRTEPWCDVYLGAEKLGTTPLIRAPVASGKRTLLLKNEKLGFSKKLTVTIAPGKELKQAVVMNQGRIQIAAPPGVEVWLDGARIGTTPLEAFDTVEGKHEVRLGAVSRKVTVKSGQTEKVSP